MAISKDLYKCNYDMKNNDHTSKDFFKEFCKTRNNGYFLKICIYTFKDTEEQKMLCFFIVDGLTLRIKVHKIK